MPKGEPLRPAGQQLVADVASQAGLVLSNVSLVEDLRASRQRLIAAQDEARRRLERNIHDGAQQDLVALAIKLRLAGMTVEDLAEAKQVFGEPHTDAAGALETCATWPGASTRRFWPTWGWPQRSAPRPASLPCR